MTAKEERDLRAAIRAEDPFASEREVQERLDAARAGEEAANRAFGVFKRAINNPKD